MHRDDPFHPRFPDPEPVEGRTLPLYLLDGEEPPAPRPRWIRWAAAFWALILTASALMGGLHLPSHPPRPFPVLAR